MNGRSCSTDGSDDVIRAWTPLLLEGGVSVVTSGSRWPENLNPDGGGGGGGGELDLPLPRAGGIGHSKNSSVRQSSGELLVFLDADDIMT